ncbi:flavin-containing monooxygenase [Williamsia sterculiae]|uniref:Cyclohexanone monooxygenase n=1 Tax=Williamsia sterculiae TaxID=1344003 RepID=A0A1N7E1A9_9NOCA|nr:NAD(P)/FAD-dependent oxidoreductase [Williamsia sterculiae]SIR81850.1 cyclohexanone monooxygenase [Williamsia sterculiae]
MNDVKIAIIGAGFSGLGAAIKLQQHGFEDFVVLDRGSDFGGTWRDNTYPGAACDVPSHLYSYSFAPNPEWTRSFSRQAEIHAYINRVAEKYEIRRRTHFNTDVQDSRWDEASNRWIIDTDRGQYRAEQLIGAIGPLCEPNLPDIKGITEFTGEIFHSARWDHDYDLTGKRVAVIGTGASAIQIIPELAKKVAHLDVYQRTAPWVLPRADRPYTGVEHWAFKNVPLVQQLSRAGIYAGHELVSYGLTHNPNLLKPAELAGRANIARAIRDPELRAKVTPTFRAGCKRLLLSNTYYPALAQANTDVVTDGIDHVDTTGIVSTDGTHRDVDVIVVATGFHVTDSPGFEHITGADGRTLAQVWDHHGMSGYKGSTVNGFPNLFLMIGPSTGLGHTSMVYMIESQLNYLVDYLRTVTERNIARIEVRADEQKRYNAALKDTLSDSVWENGGCASWYKDKFGNITTLWPGFTFNFRRATKRFDLPAYQVNTEVGTAEPVAAGVN